MRLYTNYRLSKQLQQLITSPSTNCPKLFSPNPAALKRLHYARGRETHPDFHTTSSAENQAEMLRQATLNTDAYRTLTDPSALMDYLLRRHSLPDEARQGALPPDFLMDMMGLNEQLMELGTEDPSFSSGSVIAAMN